MQKNEKREITKLENGCYFFQTGGAEEVGMNNAMFISIDSEEKTCVICDAGVSFEKADGISAKMVSASMVNKLGLQISAIVITHCHEDHTGAVIHFLERFYPRKIPIYATAFSANFLRRKFSESKIEEIRKYFIHEVPVNSSFSVGKIRFGLFNITHSTAESNFVVVEFLDEKQNVKYRAIHTGDWKFDEDSTICPGTNKQKLKELGEVGVDALITDSTNAFDLKKAVSEKDVYESLKLVVSKYCENRKVVISFFSSNIARLKTLIRIAEETNRKVVLLGPSLVKFFELAVEGGIIKKTKSYN